MAAKYPEDVERLEDIYQEEIIQSFENILDFKKFARSRNGLCLDESDIQDIVDDNPDSVEEQKLVMLRKWQEKTGPGATVRKIRSVVSHFRNPGSYKNFERLEDIYQEEIIQAFASIVDFKKFARSKNGLCFDETDIQDIVDNNPASVEEQKMLMLRKWQEKTGPGATAHKIRSVVDNFKNPESDKDYVSLSGEYGYYKSKKISKHSHVYIGEQRSQVTGPREVVIKMVELNEYNKKEAEILLHLGQNTNIVSMFHSGLYETALGTFIYIVMQACRRENLGDYLAKMKEKGLTLSESEKIAVAKQFFQGLEFIHFKSLIHRDIKPTNILISKDGKNIKLTDYGLSKVLNQGRSATILTTHRVGTDGFRSPETFEKGMITQKSDVFSSGLVLYVIVSDGEHPYEKDPECWNANIKRNQNCKIIHINLSKKKPIKKLIIQMLQVDPEKRPTVEEVLKIDVFQLSTRKLNLVEVSKLFKSVPKANVIILYDYRSKHLFSYKPSKKQWSKMQKTCDELDWVFAFTLINIEENIYALCKKKMYQTKYSDQAAKWVELQGTTEDHGDNSPAVALNGLIYVCGTGDFTLTSSSVEMYHTDSDIWTIIPGINIPIRWPCLVAAKGYIYCIGGRDGKDKKLRSVQWLELETETVTKAGSTPRPTVGAAVEKDDIIYIADDEGIQCYDIQTELCATMKTDQWPQGRFWQANIHLVDGELYIVFDLFERGVEIYKLNLTTGKMTLLKKKEDIVMCDTNSIAVKL